MEGDRELGYSSLWMLLARLRRGAAVYALTVAPFLLLAVFALAGALPWTVLALLPLSVLSVLVVTAAARARMPTEERRPVRSCTSSPSTSWRSPCWQRSPAGHGRGGRRGRRLLGGGVQSSALVRRTDERPTCPLAESVRHIVLNEGASMNQPDVTADVSEIVAQVLAIPTEQVLPQAHFYDTLGGDSLQKLEIVALIEARLGCQLDADQVASSDTVEELARQAVLGVSR
ncbi:acyl carrier protein [Streptomyces sp. M10(2022)]